MGSRKINLILVLALYCCVYTVLGCPQGCLFCLKPEKCITCQKEYSMTLDSQCLQGRISKCRVYQSENQCVICQATYRLKNNKCIKDLSGCILRDSNQKCIQCHFGTTLNIQGQCLGVINCQRPQRNCTVCRQGYILANNICRYTKDDCHQIDAQTGLCIGCKDGFVENGFECVNQGSSSIANGNINLIQNCQLYSRSERKCLKCLKGFQFFENLCKSNGQVYQNTLNAANKKIRQDSNQDEIFLNNQSQFLKYEKIKYSLVNPKDDILDPQVQTVEKIIFQGIGANSDHQNNCLIKSVNSLACQVCIDGYYLSNGLCKKKIPICESLNLTNFKCIKCNQNFLLKNGQCIDPNCLDPFYSQCRQCKEGFSTNQQGFCEDLYCKIKENGNCKDCVTGYLLNNLGYCYRIIDGCANYTSDWKKCRQCKSNYTITSQGSCSSQRDNRCIQFNATSSTRCLKCRENFALINSTCHDLNCQIFTSPNLCGTCKSGYILDSSTNSYCIDQNCILYSNGSCINCANNYELQNGFCVKIIIGCLRVEPLSQKCQKCLDVYRLTELGHCSFIQNDKCIKYSNTNLNVNGSGRCVTCRDGFALLDNGECKDLYCVQEQFLNNYYACMKCRPGFNLSTTNVCYDQNCLNTVNGTCQRCADQYVLSSSLGLCIRTTTACQAWNSTTKKCNTCVAGYALNIEGYCSLVSGLNTTFSTIDNAQTLTIDQIQNKPTLSDQNCQTYDSSNNCARCIPGRFYIRNNICQKVPQICNNYNMRTGKCISCVQGYGLYQENQGQWQNCIKKPTQQDANCQVKNLDSFCVRCKNNFYISQGVCHEADPICKTFNLKGGDCLTCYDGYTLEGKTCVLLTQQTKCTKYDFQNVCIQCVDRYYVLNGVCKQIDSLCQKYQMNGGKCLSCISGYVLNESTCKKASKFAQNCNQIDSSTQLCKLCKQRYYFDLQSSLCAKVNNLCADYNKENGTCLSCISGYKLYEKTGQCIVQWADGQCNEFSSQGVCSSCIQGYFITNEKKCAAIIQNCKEYNKTDGKCQQCNSNYHFAFGACQAKTLRASSDPNCLLSDHFNYCLRCPQNYFISPFGTCFPVNQNCKTYNNHSGQCESCYDGYLVKNGQCIDQNVLKTIQKQNKTLEELCQIFSGQLCIKCIEGFYLGKKLDGGRYGCEPVGQGCLDYDQFTGVCKSCKKNYQLSGSGCVLSGQYQSNFVEVASINCQLYDLSKRTCLKCYPNYKFSNLTSQCQLIVSEAIKQPQYYLTFNRSK